MQKQNEKYDSIQSHLKLPTHTHRWAHPNPSRWEGLAWISNLVAVNVCKPDLFSWPARRSDDDLVEHRKIPKQLGK